MSEMLYVMKKEEVSKLFKTSVSIVPDPCGEDSYRISKEDFTRFFETHKNGSVHAADSRDSKKFIVIEQSRLDRFLKYNTDQKNWALDENGIPMSIPKDPNAFVIFDEHWDSLFREYKDGGTFRHYNAKNGGYVLDFTYAC